MQSDLTSRLLSSCGMPASQDERCIVLKRRGPGLRGGQAGPKMTGHCDFENNNNNNNNWPIEILKVFFTNQIDSLNN